MTIARFPAMGTTFEVHAADTAAVRRCRERVDIAEQCFSRFRSDSELTKLNQERDMVVSTDMRAILAAAVQLRGLTRGSFDIGVGASLAAWGYSTTFEDVVNLTERPERSARGSWWLDADRVVLGPGTQLDLGGIAKGWIADQLVESGLATVVSAGGDIRSVDPTLVVDVLDRCNHVAAEVTVGSGALATSSRTRRTWMVDDEQVHHLVDPQSMRPAVSPVLSASAVTSKAVEAEAAAKTILLMGSDGLAWADSQRWIHHGIVEWHDGNVYATTSRMAS